MQYQIHQRRIVGDKLMGIFDSWKRNSKEDQEHLVDNVYGTEKLSVQNKRYNFIHFVLKYKILVPLALLMHKWLKKRIEEVDLNKKHLDYLKVFNDSYEEALVKWNTHYVNCGVGTKEEFKFSRKTMKNHQGPTRLPQLIKEIYLAINANDDAYLEFNTIFLWEVYKKMHGLLKTLEQDGKVFYVMRNWTGQSDPLYEEIYLQLRMNKSFALRGVHKE